MTARMAEEEAAGDGAGGRAAHAEPSPAAVPPLDGGPD